MITDTNLSYTSELFDTTGHNLFANAFFGDVPDDMALRAAFQAVAVASACSHFGTFGHELLSGLRVGFCFKSLVSVCKSYGRDNGAGSAARANTLAMALPIPLLAPVTFACLCLFWLCHAS